MTDRIELRVHVPEPTVTAEEHPVTSDLLRRAADRLEEWSEQAHPTLPWTVDDDNHLAFPILSMRNPWQDQARYTPGGGWKPIETSVPYEAHPFLLAMDPGLGKLLAAWLRDEADTVDFLADIGNEDPEPNERAIAVARRILGEPAADSFYYDGAEGWGSNLKYPIGNESYHRPHVEVSGDDS